MWDCHNTPRLDGFGVSVPIVEGAQEVKGRIRGNAGRDDSWRGHWLGVVEEVERGIVDAHSVPLIGNEFAFEGEEPIVEVGVDSNEVIVPTIGADVEACPSPGEDGRRNEPTLSSRLGELAFDDIRGGVVGRVEEIVEKRL